MSVFSTRSIEKKIQPARNTCTARPIKTISRVYLPQVNRPFSLFNQSYYTLLNITKTRKMKRRRKSGLVGGGEDGGKGKRNEGGNSSSNNSSRGNDNRKGKTKKDPHHPPPPVIGTVATRTRRHQRDIATKWKHPISILINIMRYADSETIRMLCCVSK